jgi:SAM-dependent methyltransferase
MSLIRRFAARQVKSFLGARGYELRRTRGDYQSETSKCRERLAPFCVGYGLDLGPGGDPITEAAIRVDLPRPYSHAGLLPVQLGGDASKLHWFRDGVLDFIYSSHLLEDFQDTRAVLAEWLRVLRPSGRLVIFCPDQQVYAAHCRRTGQPENTNHVHADFSLRKVQEIMRDIGGTREIHSRDRIDVYSWELVVEKI